MTTGSRGRWAILIPFVLLLVPRAQIRGQATAPPAERTPGINVEVAFAGGVSHVEGSTGMSAILEGGLAFGRIRLGLSPVDLTWVLSDPAPGYERTYTIAGSILCQKAESEEFVDASSCDDVSTRVGAMLDLTVLGFGGPGGLALGGGYRVGSGKGPFLSFSWGAGQTDPPRSWYLQGRIGEDFFQGSIGLPFWPRR